MQELIAEGLAVGDGSLPVRELSEAERLRSEWRGNRAGRDSRERGWGSADAAVGASSDTERLGVGAARRSPPSHTIQFEAGESRGRRSTGTSGTSKKKAQPQQRKDKPTARGREPVTAASAVDAATANIAASAAALAGASSGSQAGSTNITQWTNSRSSTDLPLQKDKPRSAKGYDASTSESCPMVITSSAEVREPGGMASGAGGKKYTGPTHGHALGHATSHSESPRGHIGTELGSSDAPRSAAAFPALSNARRAKQPE